MIQVLGEADDNLTVAFLRDDRIVLVVSGEYHKMYKMLCKYRDREAQL